MMKSLLREAFFLYLGSPIGRAGTAMAVTERAFILSDSFGGTLPRGGGQRDCCSFCVFGKYKGRIEQLIVKCALAFLSFHIIMKV